MIYLGSIMFFRWEKYRLVLVMISFSASGNCTIIAGSLNSEEFIHMINESFSVWAELRIDNQFLNSI
jgi:hypothetical protein